MSSSCFWQNRSRLTDEEKSWNPYKDGQVLIFNSPTTGLDTLNIVDAQKLVFPDGLGVTYYNERLRVIGEHSHPTQNRKSTTNVLKIATARPEIESNITFGFKCKGAQFFAEPYLIEDLNRLPEQKVDTRFGSYHDVITIVDNSNAYNINGAIELVYWSKSKGYVKAQLYDGNSWELQEIINH